ncbi:hypothetical protein [Salinispora arenicola]|uniref:hypothetical protein n=1 Tax=Salinispora arenicola TaxID=168697 RepID=UPI00169E1C00|nr:hypothetical protein [Salinispora arenicola]NIL64714.1 hypothetical protein [Salinispora arenicola]
MSGHPGVPEGLRAYAQPTNADGTFDPRPRRPPQSHGEYTYARTHPLHHSDRTDSSTTLDLELGHQRASPLEHHHDQTR